MVRLLLLAALVAGSALGQRFTPPPSWTPPIVRTPGSGVTLPPAPPAPTSYTLREGSENCAESWSRTVTIPLPERANCYRVKATEYLVNEVKAGRLRPGGKARSIVYPEITYAIWPVWVYGSVAGVPRWVCAAGIGTDPIVVSLAQPTRTLDLVAWETGNRTLVLLDRFDLTDGATVSAAMSYARVACPAY